MLNVKALINHKPVWFFMVVAIATLVIHAIATFIAVDITHWMTRSFNSVRGSLSIPEELVTIGADDKSFSILQSSARDPLSDEMRVKIIERIMESSPRALLVDLELFNGGDSAAWLERGSEREKVHYFRQEVREVTDLAPIQGSVAQQSESPLFLIFYNSKAGVSLIAPQGGPSSLKVFADVLKVENNEPQAAPRDYYINFYEQTGQLPYLPLHEVLEASQAELYRKLHDKVVFLGIKSVAFKRGPVGSWQYYVPALGVSMYGVDINATILANLLDGSWIRGIHPFLGVLLTGATAVLVSIIATKFSLAVAVVMLVVLLCLTTVAMYFCFTSLLLWSNMFPVMVIIQIIAISLRVVMEAPIGKRMMTELRRSFALR